MATLAANLEGEIRNPLKDISRAQLLKNVAEFHRSKGLPEDSLIFLRKGAIIAQNPAGFEDEEDLDEDDRQCLRDEVTRRWHHPWPLYYTIFLNSIAAAIQGWDQVSAPAIREQEVQDLGKPDIHQDRFQWRQLVLPRCSGYPQCRRVLVWP